jgi:hypothetical protein
MTDAGKSETTDLLTARRPYRGRFGQLVTDPKAIEARAMVTQLRRLFTINVKAGREWDKAVTVGELAKAAKMTVERVVAVVRHYGDAWLLGLIEVKGSAANWWVYQDGE